MTKTVIGISDCQLFDHGASLRFAIDEDGGSVSQFQIATEAIPKIVQTLVQHWSVGERIQRISEAQPQDLVAGWIVTDVQAGGLALDQQTISLRLQTDHSSLPLVALLSIEMAHRTIQRLQHAVQRAVSRGPRQTN